LIVDECFAVTLRFFASLNITESNMKERELNRANIGVAKNDGYERQGDRQ